MTNTRKSGFTLIELLIVVVIIGILASIAIPKFASTKSQAFLAAMRSDLHNLVTAEEGYYYSNSSYNSSLSQLNFQSSAGVTITVPEATAGGWSAAATHSSLGAETCTVYFGTAAALAPSTLEGRITCN
ncbi:MAG TPA: prepilin-type N-terminal cleavage/methylation domain-containing protein [Gemmatimonadaceae bacterium]|nr:prepilin-type N-terminal cleavage/methylation domain-containing protein [Gemmatimonadaceae bacterium]